MSIEIYEQLIERFVLYGLLRERPNHTKEGKPCVPNAMIEYVSRGKDELQHTHDEGIMINYDLEFQDLESYAAVYRYRNFTKAAEKLFISQPSLSRRIHAIEEELGVVLVERSGPHITFTEAGNHFYKECLRLLREKDRLYTSMNRYRSGEAGVLRIGVEFSYNFQLTLQGIDSISRDLPNVQINYENAGGAQLMRFLQEGSIDVAFAFMSTTEDVPGITSVVIAKNSLRVAVGRSHPLFEREVVSWHDLKAERLCCPAQSNDYAWSKMTEWARKAGAPIRDTLFTASTEEMLALVATGKYISFAGDINPGLFDNASAYLRYIPVEEGENRLGWHVLAHLSENRDPLIQKLISAYDPIE